MNNRLPDCSGPGCSGCVLCNSSASNRTRDSPFECVKCKELPTLVVDDEFYCEDCGTQQATELDCPSNPLVTVEDIKSMSTGDLRFLDPATILVDTSGGSVAEIFTHGDLNRTDNIVIEEGLTMYREPIAVAHCIYCEALAIGHVNKVGGWLARHRHYHETYNPNDFDGVIEA